MMHEEQITLAHGSGGRLYHQLVEEVFVPSFEHAVNGELNDSALCAVESGMIAMTTDSFVVRPRFFPGGDIGRLAVCGTVNDLAMSGAKPQYLTCGMIIETGFPVEELKAICRSMADAAAEAGVRIVTGDTKVVEKGLCDGIYINTAGVGVFGGVYRPLPEKIEEGDVIIASGSLGDHGMAVMAARHQLEFTPPIESDVTPLNGMMSELLAVVPEIHAFRDPTRGGMAMLLNEWAASSGCNICLQQESIPVKPGVAAASEILGIDPLYIANEGKFAAAVPERFAEDAIACLHKHPLGSDAAVIGHVLAGGERCRVLLQTPYGTERIVDMPEGEQLPRIC